MGGNIKIKIEYEGAEIARRKLKRGIKNTWNKNECYEWVWLLVCEL